MCVWCLNFHVIQWSCEGDFKWLQQLSWILMSKPLSECQELTTTQAEILEPPKSFNNSHILMKCKSWIADFCDIFISTKNEITLFKNTLWPKVSGNLKTPTKCACWSFHFKTIDFNKVCSGKVFHYMLAQDFEPT